MLEIMSGWCPYKLADLGDAAHRALVCGVEEAKVKQGVQAIVLAGTLEESRQSAEAVYKRGQWPLFYFTKGGQGGIRRKTYLESLEGRLPTNFWPYMETGHTDEAKKEQIAIFDGRGNFDTPKPTRLIERVLAIAAGPGDIVLDSFAGSGTTGHAVLKLNAEDGGHRQFILVEMNDYAETVTAERLRRVIKGYGEGPKAVPGTGGDFAYYELGEPLMAEGDLNAKAGLARVREYIWRLETREPMPAPTGDPYFLGLSRGTAYYFFYDPEGSTTLNYAFLDSIKERAGAYVIYADSCTLSEGELSKRNIAFRKIPRDIVTL